MGRGGLQALEEGKLGGGAERGDGEMELVEEAEALVYGIDDLVQVLFRIFVRIAARTHSSISSSRCCRP